MKEIAKEDAARVTLPGTPINSSQKVPHQGATHTFGGSLARTSHGNAPQLALQKEPNAGILGNST